MPVRSGHTDPRPGADRCTRNAAARGTVGSPGESDRTLAFVSVAVEPSPRYGSPARRRRVVGYLCGLAMLAACSSGGADSALDGEDSAPVVATAAQPTLHPVPTEAPTMTVAPTTVPPPIVAPTTEAPTPTAAPLFRPDLVGEVTVADPPVGGKGFASLGTGRPDLAAVGYTETELFLSGTAVAYSSAEPLTSDGRWSVEPIAPVPFTTRIVVRRPIDAADWNGSVAVEWFNVTAGFDNAPDWTYAHVELIRSGWAWVGVSAQAVGILGGGNALGAALALKAVDPERYAPLSHPGDSYSYDMFSQVGAAVRTQADKVLDGLQPDRVIAIGESQSAFRLTTYVDAVAPIANVFDGYLLHSRGSAGAGLLQDPLPSITAPDPTLIRTDTAVPVLNFLSETDVLGGRLGFVRARQPDTDIVRSWEVPGTAHADVYNLGIGDTDDGSGAGDAALFAAMATPPNSIFGGVITCDLPINAGPHTYVLRAALWSLESWVRTGEPPPAMAPIEIDEAGALVLDDNGNARGGIRTPHLDVPVARLTGFGQTGESFCGLFGTTRPFTAAQIAAAYPDHATFAARWTTAVDRAEAAGAILASDAVRLGEVAAASEVAG